MLDIDHSKFCMCYISELVQRVINNISIFYYDAQLGVNIIPLLASNKSFFVFKYSLCTILSLYSQIQ